MTTPTTNQSKINHGPAADTADATIGEQKRVLLQVLRQRGVQKASIAYNAFDGGLFPEKPAANIDEEFPDTGILKAKVYGLSVNYASASMLMRGLLRAVLDEHHPGCCSDEDSEGILSVDIGDATFNLHHGDRYVALDEPELEV